MEQIFHIQQLFFIFLAIVLRGCLDALTVAAFELADIDLDDHVSGVSLTLGARYETESIEDHTYESSNTTPSVKQLRMEDPSAAQSAASATRTKVDVVSYRSFNAFLPKISAAYEISENVSTSLTYQRGYRAGGTQVNNFSGKVNAFDPEHTDNYEWALRSEFQEGRVIVNANAFYTRWTNQQVNILGTSGRAIDKDTVNAGESEVIGGELSIEASATDKLALFGSLGYAETRFLDFDTGEKNFAGNQFPNAPKVTAALGGEYDFDNGFRLSIDAVYTGAKFTDIANQSKSACWLGWPTMAWQLRRAERKLDPALCS